MSISKITYAGHSSVLVNYGDKVVGIDPWLQGNPSCPENLINPDKLDLIVLTHGHADHASDTVRLAKQFGSKIAATYELAMIMIGEGISEENVFPMNKGGSINWEGLKVTLTNAFHSSSFDSETKGTVYAGEACGAVISDGVKAVYHAGDTCLFSDMKLIADMYKPDVALLPIGDVFTMGPIEAAEAAELVGCKKAIPIHYNTFPLLTGTSQEFSEGMF